MDRGSESRPDGATAEARGRAPRPLVMAFAALAVVAATYANAFHGPFLWDDRVLIVQEPLVKVLDPAAHLDEAFWRKGSAAEALSVYYRPLTTWTYALDWARSGGRPGPFHATNVLLHLLACALVFALARRAGAGGVSAGLAAALFGALPRLTESVTWISGRTDVLAAVFTLSALLLHRTGQGGSWRRAAAALALLLGLFSKEVAAAGFAGLAAMEAAAARRERLGWRRPAAHLLPAAAALAAYAAARVHAMRNVPAFQPPAMPARGWMPLQAVGQYLAMLLDPLRPRLQIGLLGRVEPGLVALGALSLLALGAVLVRGVRSPPPPLASGLLAAALAALLPVLHLVRISVNVVAADRFLYVTAACLAAAAAAGASRLRARARTAALAAALVAVPAFGLAAHLRNEDWDDEVRLWRAAVATSPASNPLPVHELGNALSEAGRLAEALPYYEEALERAGNGPNRVGALSNIAATLSDLGRLDEARLRTLEILRLGPDRPVYHYNLAIVDARLLRFDEAEAELGRALALLPSYPEARRALGFVREMRQAYASLPAPSGREPTSARARRASFWSRLGVPQRAGPLWREVAAAPDASLDDLEQAAAWLAANGGRDEATAAVARARRAGVPASVAAAMEAVIAGRFASPDGP